MVLPFRVAFRDGSGGVLGKKLPHSLHVNKRNSVPSSELKIGASEGAPFSRNSSRILQNRKHNISKIYIKLRYLYFYHLFYYVVSVRSEMFD